MAKSFSRFAYRQETRSSHTVKLSKINETENNLEKDLRDFVALNLHALVEKEGIEVVLRNAAMTTNKKIEELEENMRIILKREEERELRRKEINMFIICILALNFFTLLYVIIYNNK